MGWVGLFRFAGRLVPVNTPTFKNVLKKCFFSLKIVNPNELLVRRKVWRMSRKREVILGEEERYGERADERITFNNTF